MSAEIHRLTLGVVATNAYLVIDPATRAAVLIDPVDFAPNLLAWAQEQNASIQRILATHAHFDHIMAARELKELTGAPFWLHADAAAMLPYLPGASERFTGRAERPAEPDSLIADGEAIALDGLHFTALYTPGHAPGHLAFYMPDEGVVFSGDALFAGAVGRWDIPGADRDTLMTSIHTRLLTLPDDTRVLAGHGDETTIGEERVTNPYVRRYRPTPP